MASAVLPFWPKAAAMAYLATGSGASIYTKAFPTNGFTEVVIQLGIDADFGVQATTYVQVYPQISNDGINWEEQTSPVLQILSTASFPAIDVEKFTEIGAFMRMRIYLYNNEGAAAWFGATIEVTGTGRS